MDIVYVGEKATPSSLQKSIFLAGPSPREENHLHWRPEALNILSSMSFNGTVFVPLTRDGVWLGDYDAQANWELDNLVASTAIAFWVPRDLVTLPGFTTNVEFGLFADSGKSVLGYPLGAAKTKYLHHLAKRKGIPVYHTLQETLAATIRLVNGKLD